MSNQLLSPSIGSIAVDGVAILIIVGCVLLGAKKGFVRSILSALGGLLSLFFAVLLCSSVARFLQGKYGTVTSVSKWLSGVLSNIFGETLMNTPLSTATEDSLLNAGLGGALLKLVLSLKGNVDITEGITLGNIIAPVFSYYIVAIISAIGLYIIFRMIFFVIGEIVKKLHSFKTVGKTDKTLGALIGAVRGIISIEILLMLFSAIPLGLFQDIMALVQSTFIVRLIDAINIFNLILHAIMRVNVSDIISGVKI